MSLAIKDWVLGSGPASAKLFICGEAPGKNEAIQGKCFVGPSGELLTEMLENAQINRSSCYITNVIKINPPGNDLTALNTVLNEETGKYYEIEDFLPLLFNEIEAIQPNLILAVGSLACKILTGKEGIKNWRGSILPLQNFHPDSTFQFTRSVKVIPTIHPAALFERNYKKSSAQGMFTWKQKAHIQFDIFKAAREKDFPDFSSIPNRNLEVVRSSIELERFFNMYRDYHKVYVDTEVFKAHLVCIGFAFTRYHGISIPLIDLQDNENFKGIPLHELTELWRIVAEKLADPNLEKAGQNFKADKVYWLEKAGFVVNNFKDDGMFKIHTLSPELPKSLAFQQSVWTNEPFHKFEGKEYNPRKDNINVLLKYNAKDCVVNCECIEEMDKDLAELGLQPFYDEYVIGLQPIYEKIEKKGWLINKEKKKELSKFYSDLLLKEEAKLAALLASFDIEEELNYDSPKQVANVLFVKLRLPHRADTGDETLTALMNNAVKDKRKKEIISSVLDCRSISKLKTVYVDFQEDLDGRMRCSYNQVGTETGRTSTSIIKKPLRNGKWGVAIQTNPRPDEFGGKVREIYIADPGKVLLEFDQSQAEARLVALIANDLELLRLFDVTDVHKLTASFVYNYTPRSGQDLIKSALAKADLHNDECYCSNCREIRAKYDLDFSFLNLVNDQERQIGKNTRHGCAYDLGEDGLSIKMKISRYRAKVALEKVHEMSPNIRSVFQEGIQEALANNNKTLWTPFGRRREFLEQWGKKLFREAYAHIPQSTIGDNTKRAMKGIEKEYWIEILAETHDAFICQVPENQCKEAYQIIKPIFEQPINFDKCTIKREDLTIPVNCKIGESWGTLKTYRGE